MKMQAKIGDDGSVTYNGTKIYTTNGAVADYFSTYGVTDISKLMILEMGCGTGGVMGEYLGYGAPPENLGTG